MARDDGHARSTGYYDHRLTVLLDAVADIEVVGEAADGDQAVRVAAGTRPDVVLMDLSMPGTDGVTATRRLLAEHPDLQVLVLTSFSDRARVGDALDAGATGYLLKDTPPADVVSGIRAAARRESPLDPRIARALLEDRPPTPRSLLGPRETEVLQLVARGMANKQIARTLGIRRAPSRCTSATCSGASACRTGPPRRSGRAPT